VLLIGGPLIVLSIAGAGWLLAGAALRPVRRMAAEADTIAITDLSRRIAAPEGNDEIAALAHTLNDMLDRIETSVDHERRFIDDASHELRTPLSILRGELELALAAPDADDLVDSLTSALEETDRLSRLSGDLLALARARAELRAAKVEAVDLRQVAERIGALLSDDEGPAVRCVGDSVVLRGERDRVDRILLNTIANARRYASAQVEVRIERDGDGVALVVADDGPGFPTSMLPVAFERFRRGDPTRARDTGGTGLGLAIVAELVRTMGGRITAGNGDVLGGAWVRAWFPLEDESDGA
jgi:signal transduction histidine kinase